MIVVGVNKSPQLNPHFKKSEQLSENKIKEKKKSPDKVQMIFLFCDVSPHCLSFS